MIETTKTSEWLTPREAGEYLGVELPLFINTLN
jgi:hypothetical protein